MLIRFFDILLSGIGLFLCSPLFLYLAVWIKMDSKGSVFYKQIRVGREAKDFKLYKFRSMVIDADKQGLITVGERDPRVTRSGYFIRKYKLDELPQLINVFVGDMSMVGPRPEVRKYVEMYNEEECKVLTVKPGITDYASIEYINENEILAGAEDPERAYIDVVMPAKIRLNMIYITRRSLSEYFKVIGLTVLKIIF